LFPDCSGSISIVLHAYEKLSLTSIGYPNGYQPNLNCTLSVHFPNSGFVLLIFDDVQLLTSNESCVEDFIRFDHFDTSGRWKSAR